jgi:hypothetical protein
MSEDTTKVINMSELLGAEARAITQQRMSMLFSHARVMCMMFEATHDNKYLQIAKCDINHAKCLKEPRFVQLFNCDLTA